MDAWLDKEKLLPGQDWGLEIKKAMPYMGSNFALANNLNQPITIKYPTDTASIILKETAGDMVKIAQRLRAM